MIEINVIFILYDDGFYYYKMICFYGFFVSDYPTKQRQYCCIIYNIDNMMKLYCLESKVGQRSLCSCCDFVTYYI